MMPLIASANTTRKEKSLKSENVVIAGILTESLGLAMPPIAVCFTDQLPTNIKVWQGRVPAGCRFWQEAASGVFATVPRDHGLCAIGMFTHNLETSEAENIDRSDALRVFADVGYVREQDISGIPILESRFAYVIYGPLASIPLTPDSILLFGKTSEMLILAEASQQVEGGLAPAMGRPACAIVPQAVNTGRAALSLGCCGARAYLDTLTDDIAIWAIPGPKLNLYAERVRALSKANSVLSAFHRIRREAVAKGQSPTIKDSLAAMMSAY
jgi:uncharacterized protein (DUF169 family)